MPQFQSVADMRRMWKAIRKIEQMDLSGQMNIPGVGLWNTEPSIGCFVVIEDPVTIKDEKYWRAIAQYRNPTAASPSDDWYDYGTDEEFYIQGLNFETLTRDVRYVGPVSDFMIGVSALEGATLTTRTSDTAGELTFVDDTHGVSAGDTIIISWTDVDPFTMTATVDSTTGEVILFSGGSGDPLPVVDTVVTFQDENSKASKAARLPVAVVSVGGSVEGLRLINIVSTTPDSGGWPAFVYINHGNGTFSSGSEPENEVRIKLTPNGGTIFAVGDHWAMKNGTVDVTVDEVLKTFDLYFAPGENQNYIRDCVDGLIKCRLWTLPFPWKIDDPINCGDIPSPPSPPSPPPPPPPMGACSYLSYDPKTGVAAFRRCEIRTEAECAALSGSYAGDGTSCRGS